jgi:CTD kinase subunit beta
MQDVVLAALYVATKMHDTLKKPQDLLLASSAIRFPERGATHQHDKTRLLAIERLILETICFNFTSRLPFPYVIKLGRAFKGKSLPLLCPLVSLILFQRAKSSPGLPGVWPSTRESVCPHPLPFFADALRSYRTLIPVQYPPHTVALGSLYTASLLSSFEQAPSTSPADLSSPHGIAAILSKRGSWETKYHAQVEDLEGEDFDTRTCKTYV